MKTHIGILQAGATPTPLVDRFGDYPQMLENLISTASTPVRFTTYRAIDGCLPSGVDDCDAWIISGSKHSVTESLPWMCDLSHFIRSSIAANLPTIGICFGHQIMAQALGGVVGPADVGWLVGPKRYSMCDDGASNESIVLNAFHQDQVLTPPTQSRTIGRSDSCQFAILEYGDVGLSFQAHPEFSPSFVRSLAEYRQVHSEYDDDTGVETWGNSLVPQPKIASSMIVDKVVGR